MGERKIMTKRGFATKKEALEYEREFLQSQAKDLDMTFKTFVEDHYLCDVRNSIEDSTYYSKMHRIRTKIMPYFGKKKMASITSNDILKWQTELQNKRDKNGKAYSPTYLRSIQNDLNAIFNHAYKFYDMRRIPTRIVTKMGKSKCQEIEYWTLEEYEKFIETMRDEPIFYYAFETLYWTGIREGELLGLKRKDFDFEKKTLRIVRQFQSQKGEHVEKDPKTENGIRVIALPTRLNNEIEQYCDSIYGCDDETRLFELYKSPLHRALTRGCDKSGVKRITIHGFRHSHVAYLISLGFTLYEIGKRVGHSDQAMTERYAHLTPQRMYEVANRIDLDLNGKTENVIKFEGIREVGGA
jgi:integrase